jgi:hypothetical protein
VVTDRANSARERVVFVLKSLADLIVRLNPKQMPLEDEEGRSIEVVRWLKGQHAPGGRVCCRLVWISYQGQRYLLRLIALRKRARAAFAQRNAGGNDGRAGSRRTRSI